MAFRRRALGLAFTLAALVAPASAQAALSTWSSLPGLSAGSGAQWIRTFAYDTVPPTTVYAGTEGGGVFRSFDGGANWSSFNPGLDDIQARDVRALLISGQTIYAGTEAGLFKSEGGGQWKPVAQGTEQNPAQPKKLNQSVESLISLPGGVLLAGVFSGGVYKSTDDGDTWTPPPPGNGMPAHQTVNSVSSFPQVPGIVFAASGTGLYRSTNAGSTWSLASDGIPGGASPNMLWVDGSRPNVHYVGTTASGIYRSTNGGLTYSAVNAGLGAVRARGLQIFHGDDGAVVYAATEEALWAGRVDSPSASPPPPVWRQVTTEGLTGPGFSHTIFWALTAPNIPFGGVPGLIAGTQSDGGYFIAFEPPDSACPNTAPTTPNPPSASATCPKITGTVQVGQTLEASPGTWTGTQPIDFAFQWQRCSSSAPTSCADIADATEETYVVKQTDFDGTPRRFRLVVTATNAFPSFDVVERYSVLTSQTAANPALIPGASQVHNPDISVLPPGDGSAPKVGDSLFAEYGTTPSATTDGWFNPKADSRKFQWLRCSGFIQLCSEIPGATQREYRLVTADGRRSLRVRVTGVNAAGSRELLSADTNTVISEPASATESPVIFGDAYPGETLIGTVGGWKDPSTGFRRQWLRCDADGGFCTNVQEIDTGDPETGPSYNVREEDLGYTLRLRVIADVNGDITDGLDNALPNAVEVETAPTAVVALRPVADVGAGGPGDGAGDVPGGGPGGGAGALADAIAPVLSSLSLTNRRFTVGSASTATVAGRRTPRGTTFRFRLSEPATATLAIDRLLPGRKVGRKCKAPTRKLRKRKKCTRAKRAGTLTRRNLPAGAIAVPFSGRIGNKKLAPGSYQLTVVATDAAGNRSTAGKAKFTVVRR